MAKTIEIEVTVPEGMQAGDTFKVEVEAPVAEKKPRGMLAGLSLEEMTDDQLKRELINANSVLYKATQRGSDELVIAANQARVDAAKAEKAKRSGVTETVAAPALEATMEVDAEVAEEI